MQKRKRSFVASFKILPFSHPIAELLIFFLSVFFIFYLTFSGPGTYFSELLNSAFIFLSKQCRAFLLQIGVAPLMIHFLIDGIFLGVCSVIAFVPQTVILFFFLSALEDSGYLDAAAILLDSAMRPFGLPGKAISALLIGFGCSVPAMMSASDLKKEERENLAYVFNFLPCNARLPVLLFFVSSFFESYPIGILLAFYLFLIFLSFLGLFLRNASKKRISSPLAPSLTYRIPRPKKILKETGRQLSDFLLRAATLVFFSCVLMNLFGILTPSFQITDQPEKSILVLLGNTIAPLFSFCGLNDGRIIVALAMGFFAKESIISAIRILIPEGITSVCSLPSAVALIVFSMTYMPCAAMLCALRQTLGLKKTAQFLLLSVVRASLLAFILYNSMYLLSSICSF